MKKFFLFISITFFFISCKEEAQKGKFEVSGEIKNIADQKIYLEQLFFSKKDPEVLDTAEIKKGKFKLSAVGEEEGMYRLRLEKMDAGFIFINDRPLIGFKADTKNITLEGPAFNTPANGLLKNFILALNEKQKKLVAVNEKLEQLRSQGNDSLMLTENLNRTNLADEFKNFIVRYIDTTSDPVMAMFALGYTKDLDPAILLKPVSGLAQRFPNHSGIAYLMVQFNQLLAEQEHKKNNEKKGFPQVGSMAPEITMNDTEGKPFSLSQLKGKYVLVDFWASWCGPCRGENPNVVAAYNKYKDKNFTVLGVSLDDNKGAWLAAIKNDNLTWKHISDLKYWKSAAVELYGFDGIPYNVLLDPEGKILAVALRQEALEEKLEEILD